MTLLGFAVGTAPAPEPLDMSLDEMIASRRSAGTVGSTSATKKTLPKKVSNTDRAIGTARAKRSAVMAARRGLSTTNKASAMEIDKEVTKQAGKTAVRKARQQQEQPPPTKKQPAAEDGAARAARRRQQRTTKREADQAAKTSGTAAAAANKKKAGGTPNTVVAIGRAPSKKAIKAAVNAMEESGFQIPKGMQMVISFAPTVQAAPAEPKPKPKSSGGGTGRGDSGDGRRRGGRGRGRGGGGAGGGRRSGGAN